jgi:hypothetical protein
MILRIVYCVLGFLVYFHSTYTHTHTHDYLSERRHCCRKQFTKPLLNADRIHKENTIKPIRC